MRNRRTLFGFAILSTILGSAAGAVSIHGQGGTGKMPSPPRPPIMNPGRGPILPRKTSPPAHQIPLPLCSAKSPKQATGRTHAVNLSGGVKLEMVEIPAGSFCMGSAKENDELPLHRVTISKAFFIGKYEITQTQWQAVMGNNPSRFKGGDRPVERVSWDDARRFLNKLNALNDGFTYRLPTEAEWEYASRAGTTGDYAGNLDAMAWYGSNSGNQTHPVGQKQANSFGLYDLHGNVEEWAEDAYHPSYRGAPTDGSAWESGAEQDRVLRGGSWINVAAGLRSAGRNRAVPGMRNDVLSFGFRVVAQ